MTQTRLVVAPVIVVAVAFALLLLGNRFLVGSPIDGTTFGSLVVIPLWCAAPAFAGFSWRGFRSQLRLRYAVMCALAVGGVAAILIWQSASAPAVDCRPSYAPLELIPPSLAVGAVVFGFFALGCWFASVEIAAGRIGRGVIYGVVTQLLVIPFASVLFTMLFFGLCQRP